MLAYDLSGVPAANRASVVYAWYNDDTGDYIQSGAYYGMPRDYTIDANAAPGGSVPTTGWTTLVTVSGNSYPDREHVLSLAGYNWVRIRITATRGGAADIQADVHDVSQGDQDDWLFLGDSITMEAFSHHNIDGSAWTWGNFAQLVNASVPGHFPLTIDGGVGGTTMSWAYANRVALLQNFTGQFVAISFGTNDANISGPLDATTVNNWYANLLAMVDYVTGLGKTPIVGKFPWGSSNGGSLATNARTLNNKIDQLYQDRPGVIHGPDLYTFFANHQNLIGDGIHPTYNHSDSAGTYQGYVGYEWLLRQWRDAMVSNVYSAAPPAAAAVSISPASLSFDNQGVGTISSARTVSLSNSGNAALTISSIAVTGSNPGDFSETSDCPVSPNSLAAGAACTISVTFTPAATGSRSASLSVRDAAGVLPQQVALSGAGAAAGVSLGPASLSFGNQPVGTTSADQAVTLSNSGNEPLTISSISFSGTNPTDFRQTNTCPSGPSTLAAGATCAINLTFTPTINGSETASLAIADNASGSPQSVGLSGTGSTTSSQLFSDGFESGSLPGAWTKTTVSDGNSLTLDSSNLHSGSASLRAEMVQGTGTDAKLSKTIIGQTSIDVRAYYDLSSPINWGNVPIMTLYAEGNFIGWLSYYVDPDTPTLSVYNGANNVSYDCSLPSLNAWHTVELQYVLSTTTAGSFTVWVDGVKACGASNIRTSRSSGATIDQVVVGVDDADTTVGLTVNMDDAVIGKNYIGP